MSKSAQLLAALQAGRTVTRLTALATFKIANLTAEIATLRAQGYRIVTVKGDDGTGTTYTKYTYAGKRRPAKVKRA
jgi:hypothetical protein